MKKNVMAIGSHPDDIEIGAAGALLRHREQSDNIVIVIMTITKSVSGVTGETLRSENELDNESSKSAQLLGCNLEFLPFMDLHVPFCFESISALEKLILKYDIDTIYTHWSGDTNQDHKNTLKTTMAAGRLIPNVLCYEQFPLPRVTNVYPVANFYVDITDVFEEKIELIKCHESQIKKYAKHGFDVLDSIETLAKYRGNQIGVTYAEAFDVLKMVK